MSGRRPLPTNVKKLRGNPGKRKLNDAEPKVETRPPEMPPDLPELAQTEWKAIVPLLLALKVLSEVDGKALAAYCFAYARWMQAESEIERLGIVVEEPILGGGQGEVRVVLGYRYKRNPAVGISHEALKLMKSFLIEFGLTPASRSRLKIEKAAEMDPFDAYLSGKQNGAQAVN
jgi:P27 family predicted phage terminase small subunit